MPTTAPLAQAEADAAGNFVAIFQAEPSAEPRALTLGAATPDGGEATSDEVVMLLPKPPAAPAPDAPRRTREPPRTAVPAQRAAAGRRRRPRRRPAATAAVDAAERGAGGGGDGDHPGGRGRGRAGRGRPATARVALATISYARPARSRWPGVGGAGSVLRAYVDDRFAKEAMVGSDGRWSMELGDVAAGLYTLRIDQLAPDGKVASRIETPFQRDYPRAPLPRPGQPAPVPGRAS